jgi:hypothetical protein
MLLSHFKIIISRKISKKSEIYEKQKISSEYIELLENKTFLVIKLQTIGKN